jgi:hypothetical protein
MHAKSSARAVIGTQEVRAVHASERRRANVNPPLRAIIRSVLTIAHALSILANSVTIAIVLAIQQFTIVAVETLMAVALAIAAHPMIGATKRAINQRTIESRESLVAFA